MMKPCFQQEQVMLTPLVSIIIPVFNQWRYTEECLTAILRHSSSAIPLEVVVVDNASTDETASALRSWQSQWTSLRVERFTENSGFSPACNHGAQVSRGRYLLFLNNDTIPQPGWLEPLLDELQQPGVGLVGPKLVYPDGKSINHAGYAFGLGSFYGIYHEHNPDAPEVNKKRNYQALLGACILLSRDLFFELGQFSLDGLEDIDLCLKVRTQSLTSRYVPSSIVYHHGSVTLLNSEPGTFPITSDMQFQERWRSFRIAWDDYLWYLEDGIWPGPLEGPFTEGALERANSSVAELLEAYQLQYRGDFEAALGRVRVAMSLWPCNPMALLLQCTLLEALGRSKEALAGVLQFGEISFFRGPVLVQSLDIIERIQNAQRH